MTKTATEAKIEQLIDQAYPGYVYSQEHYPTHIITLIRDTLIGKRVFFTEFTEFGYARLQIYNERLSKLHSGLFTSTPSTVSGVVTTVSNDTVIQNVSSWLMIVDPHIEVRDVRDETEASDASEFVSDAEFDALAVVLETFVKGAKPFDQAMNGLTELLMRDDSPVFYCHGTCFKREGFHRQVFDYVGQKYDERVVA